MKPDYAPAKINRLVKEFRICGEWDPDTGRGEFLGEATAKVRMACNCCHVGEQILTSDEEAMRRREKVKQSWSYVWY